MLRKLPVILDRELNTANDDKFGHKDYSDALEQIIEGKYEPPYSIGLLGSWGVGKSTIKKFYINGIQNDRNRRSKIKTISFNAWKAGGQNIKEALILHVASDLSSDDLELYYSTWDELYNQIIRDVKQEKINIDKFKEVLKYLGTVLLSTLVLFGLTKLMGVLNTYTAFGAIFFSSILGQVIKDVSNIKYQIEFTENYKQVVMPIKDSSLHEAVLQKILKKYLKRYDNAKLERIVIFIDDLDRLSPSEMIEGIDAIRVFMEMQLPEDINKQFKGFVFVVSCDEDKIAKALNPRKITEEPIDSVSSLKDARNYLDRIFQFRLDIAPLPKGDLQGFSLKLLNENIPYFENEMKAIGTSSKNIISRLIHSSVTSPRNAIQILNAFIQSWWLAKRRESRNTLEYKAGALQENVITSYPEVLAVITVLKVSFNEFYKHLVEESTILNHFNRLFVDSDDIEFDSEELLHMNEKAELIIKKMTIEAEKKNDGMYIRKLHPQYMDLRRYLTSVRSVAFPKSIKPFLNLTQEYIERTIGDYSKLREAFINADIYGVLREMNEHLHENFISNDSLDIINKIIDSMEFESDVIINNTCFVISTIAKRIPYEYDNRGIACFWMHHYKISSKLRYMIGIDLLKDMIHILNENQILELGKILIDEFLNKKVTFKDFAGQDLSDEQKNDLSSKVLKLLVDISASHQDLSKLLLAKLKEYFTNEDNEIKIHNIEDIYISSREIWGLELLIYFMNIMLESFNDWSNQLTDLVENDFNKFCFEKDFSDIIKQPLLNETLQKVFIYASGRILKKLRKFMVDNLNQLDDMFIGTYSKAVLPTIKSFVSEDLDGYTYEDELELIVQLSKDKRFIEYDEESLSLFKELLIQLEEKQEYDENLIQLVENIKKVDSEEYNKITTSWSDKYRNAEVSEAKAKYLVKNIDIVTDSIKNGILSYINQFTKENTSFYNSKQHLKNFAIFIKNIREDALLNDGIKNNIINKFSNVCSWNSSYKEGFLKLFNILKERSFFFKKQPIQMYVKNLIFNDDFKNYIDAYSDFIIMMKDVWQEEVNEGYNIEDIIKKVKTIVSNNNSLNATKQLDVLYSLHNLAQKGDISDSLFEELYIKILEYWKGNSIKVNKIIQSSKLQFMITPKELINWLKGIDTDSLTDVEINKFKVILNYLIEDYNEDEIYSLALLTLKEIKDTSKNFIVKQIKVFPTKVLMDIIKNQQELSEDNILLILEFMNYPEEHGTLDFIYNIFKYAIATGLYKVLDKLVRGLGKVEYRSYEQKLDVKSMREILTAFADTQDKNMLNKIIDFIEWIGIEEFMQIDNFNAYVFDATNYARVSFKNRFEKRHYSRLKELFKEIAVTREN